MKLSNSMEQAVRVHLNQIRAQSQAGDETCWCPLCRADMMALALTSLPPRYATSRPRDVEIEARLARGVRDEVAHARRQVERHPKHPKGVAVAPGEPVWVVNFPLEEGFRAVDAILRRHDNACDCWYCRCDMVAFALNRYPARYGVEHEGQTHLFEEDREQMRDELSAFLDPPSRLSRRFPATSFRPHSSLLQRPSRTSLSVPAVQKNGAPSVDPRIAVDPRKADNAGMIPAMARILR